MKGKTVVITGATSGIGEVGACRLAAAGARIVFIARDAARTAETLSRLQALGPQAQHVPHLADLSSLAEMKRVAQTIAAREPKIDVLINNAGALFSKRELTSDGLERTFALNHMAYFVITNLLLAQLQAAPAGRIVSTASDAHRGARLDFDDLQSERGYSAFGVYGRSKLMNILFTRELARRLSGTRVTANCLHPGFVASRFGAHNEGMMAVGLRFAKRFALTPEQGAQTLVYLASSAEVAAVSGRYFDRCTTAVPRPQAQNDADAQRLWEISARLAGLPTS
jgi:NAD(P)-dependent dehydrogenase (short-subunit alcohol dehydrogenase family)